jgi:hypothetical protein
MIDGEPHVMHCPARVTMGLGAQFLPSSALSTFLCGGNRMKSEYPVSLIKDTGPSNDFALTGTEAIATSIARLTEENEKLRCLAVRLISQLEVTPLAAADAQRPRRDKRRAQFHVK